MSEGAAARRWARDPLEASIPLSGGRLDRADALRDDAAGMAALRARDDARGLALSGGKALIDLPPSDPPARGGAEGPQLGWRALSALAGRSDAAALVFLGRDPESGAGRFAMDIGAEAAVDGALAAPEGAGAAKFIDLRSIAAELPAGDAATAAEAKSLTSWHESHRFCARCGAESAPAAGGWRRDCPSCGARHFPRTDPVVIMLVLHRAAATGERLLIGRQPAWPPGMHSLLAGYVEPGETIEEAVRRETFEEAGVRVGRVGYLASQPWPFPSTLMIGCWGEALTEELHPDETELEAVAWIDRESARAALAGADAKLLAPRKDAIARVVIEAWAEGRLDDRLGPC